MFSEEIMGILDMTLWIADQNAADVKYRDKVRGPLRGSVVTEAMIEKQEWNAFRAKLAQRKKFLVSKAKNVLNVDDVLAEGAALDVDEDDIDQLIQLANVFNEHYESQKARGVVNGTNVGLTLAEIVRALQQANVLSVEFTAPAREQTKRLLQKLREMKRVWQDEQGRWALL